MTQLVLSSTGTAITSDMLEPVVDSITSNIAVILPIGVVVFGIMIGISLVPRILKKFTKA